MDETNDRSNIVEARLDLVPTSPGVYLMKNAAGSVIYVGKAINLRNRLRSYFGPNPKGNEKVHAMIAHIRDFSYLLVNNELEALVLESNLIKRYQPFYNILLKDDHDYPYLRITMQEAYPRLVKAYRVGPDAAEGARYFGPYLAGDLYRALRSLHDIFPVKTCRRVFPRDIGRERPCLNYHIHRCIGPCRGDVSQADYRAVMQSVCDYLDGRYSRLIQDMRTDMQTASENLEFERAARIRDRLAALEKLTERQIAVSDIRNDCDALGLCRSGGELCVLKLEVRDGKISGTSTFFLSAEGEDDRDAAAAFVEQHYPVIGSAPPEILVGLPLEGERRAALETALAQLSGRRVCLKQPVRGTKRALVEMAGQNAGETVRRRDLMRGTGRTAVDEALRMLQDLCGMEQPPARIEAYDISNTGPDDQACGMVVFEQGKPQRSQYRRFKIQRSDGQDDYAAMREAVTRRLAHGPGDARFGVLPDLILLDGGGNHVAVIRQAMAAAGTPPIAVAGMVKDGRHRTRGLALGGRVVAELAQNLGLARGTYGSDTVPPEQLTGYGRESQMALLRLLTAVQDEAHRYAGRYTETLGRKRRLKYHLEEIPGIGPAWRRKLMAAFKSIRAVSEADPAALLAALPGLGPVRAQAVFDHFHAGQPPDGQNPNSELSVSKERKSRT